MTDKTIAREIFRKFKNKGLSLTADASRALERILSKEDDSREGLDTVVNEIMFRIQKRESKKSHLPILKPCCIS